MVSAKKISVRWELHFVLYLKQLIRFSYPFQLIVIFLIPTSANSQIKKCPEFGADYVPYSYYKKDSIPAAEIKLRIETRTQRLSEGKSQEVRKVLKSINTEIIEYISHLDSTNILLAGDSSSVFVNSILDKVLSSNEILKNRTYLLFILKSEIPNATSLGEGIIFFYTDLLSKQKVEAQVAYVLCHELAHDFFEDVSKKIVEYAMLFTDNELKSQLKKALKQKYNNIETLEKILDQVNYKHSSFAQSVELKADSLGLVFFRNAGYDPQAAISTIMQLDSLDKPVFRSKIKFEKYLSFPGLPFDKSLLYEDTTDLSWEGNIEKELPDSLKTHPDCKIRAEKIKSMIDSTAMITEESISISYFNTMALFENIQHLMDEKLYGKAIYNSFSLLNYYPENIYLKCVITECLFELGEAVKNHNYSCFVEMPSSDFDHNYNLMLRLLNNARYSDLEKFAENFYLYQLVMHSSNVEYAGYLDALIKHRKVPDEEASLEIFKKFCDKFPDSIYKKQLEKKLNIKTP